MDLQPYVDAVRHELAVAAAAGGPDAEALADRLTAPLESAIRLALLEALSEAAEQITRELAPGSVEVRLRGRDPEFTVSSGVRGAAGRAGRRRARVRGRRWHVAGDAAAAGEPAGRRRRGRARATGCRSTRGWSARSPPHSAAKTPKRPRGDSGKSLQRLGPLISKTEQGGHDAEFRYPSTHHSDGGDLRRLRPARRD